MTLRCPSANSPSVSGSGQAAGDVEPSSRVFFWVLAVFLSCLTAFAVLEASIRLFYRRPVYPEKLIHVRSADLVLLYETKPNARATLWGVPVETNSLGHRGDEFVDGQPRPVGERRIVVLGDSVAFGWGVGLQDAFPKQMQNLLNASAGTNRSYVVFNLAVVGYNTAQEIQALKLKGLPLDPHLVVVAYCLNDPDRFTGDYVRYFYPPVLETIYYTSRAIDKLWQWWIGLDYHHYVHHRYRNEVRMNLEELARIARGRKLPVVLVIVPSFNWNGDRYPYRDIHEFVSSEATRRGIPVIDLWKDFRGWAPGDVSLDIFHPNRKGHEVIARRLAEFALKLPEL